jgi:hypothetical protein
MPGDLFMTDSNNVDLETPALSDGYLMRSEQAAANLRFAAEQLQEISDDDLLPGSPANWDEPKMSLLAHPAIFKAVRILASVVACENHFHLQQFESMRPASFINELRSEIGDCRDAEQLNVLKLSAQTACDMAEQSAQLRKSLWDEAKVWRAGTVSSVNNVIRFCRFIIGEWLEKIPAENFKSLADELERLESLTLPEKMKWFGLADLIPPQPKE